MTTGLYDDERVGELFLRGPKVGSDIDSLVDDAATMCSILLQMGMRPADLARRLTVDGLMRRALGIAAEIEDGQ